MAMATGKVEGPRLVTTTTATKAGVLVAGTWATLLRPTNVAGAAEDGVMIVAAGGGDLEVIVVADQISGEDEEVVVEGQEDEDGEGAEAAGWRDQIHVRTGPTTGHEKENCFAAMDHETESTIPLVESCCGIKKEIYHHGTYEAEVCLEMWQGMATERYPGMG
jgi:hypothetical protein